MQVVSQSELLEVSRSRRGRSDGLPQLVPAAAAVMRAHPDREGVVPEDEGFHRRTAVHHRAHGRHLVERRHMITVTNTHRVRTEGSLPWGSLGYAPSGSGGPSPSSPCSEAERALSDRRLSVTLTEASGTHLSTFSQIWLS